MFPPRRLLAIAAAMALISTHADAKGGAKRPKPSLDGAEQVCPLGTFQCPPRPYIYAMCRPNAMLSFYDPALGKNPELRETSPAHVQAEHVDSSDRSIYHLSGNAQLERADQKLQANTVDYNDSNTDYDARGNVRYQEAGELMASSHIRGNTNAGRGIADDVKYQLLAGRGNGVAKQGHMIDAQHTVYSQASYSTCDVGHHVWEFRGKTITLNKDTGVGVARNATLRLGKVPFIYLPYFRFPIDHRRESGFLAPTLANTSRSGFEVSTPYYLNLAPNYDATLDPRVYTERGPMLAGEFRYLEPGSSGKIDFQYVPTDHGDSDGLADTKNKQRYLINASDVTTLWQNWAFVGSVNHVSDASYMYDYGDGLSHSMVYQLGSTAQIVGSGKWWNASFGGKYYENTNPFATDASLPYQQLPYAQFSMDVPLSRWLEFGMDTQAASFHKNGAVDGSREDIYPYLQGDFGTSAWFVRPKLAYRYTAYQLQNTYQNYGYYGLLGSGSASPFTDKSPSRSVPITSIDSGLIFDRSISLFGQHFTQTLEPRLYYLYVPYRNQDNLPLFDTNLNSFDYWELFSANQFSGADRQMNANNLTGAITSRLLDDEGVERVSASVGQIHYFARQRVQLPNGQTTVAPATDWVHSSYVAQLDVQLTDRWRLNTSYQWSPNTRHTDVAAFELQHRLGNDGIFNLSYHYRRGLLEQYTASVVYPVSERWRLIGSVTYSPPITALSSTPTGIVEALAGVEFDSCCVTLQLVDRNYINQDYYGVAPVTTGSNTLRDNAVMFQIIFKGLGSSGGQIDPILHRDIIGYQ